jgi:hypothetical protein
VQRRWHDQPHARVEVCSAASGRRVLAAPEHRIPQRIPRQILRQVACEAAIGAEQRCAGVRRALTSLVAVRIRSDADAPSNSEGVFQQPVEGAPVRMHFDAPFKRLVVRVEQVGVATTDMRQAEDVAFQPEYGVQRLDLQGIQVRV